MAVLRPALVAAIAAAGCYEPEFRECVIACARDADCGPGQVCGEDRLCLAASSERCDREIADAASAPLPSIDASAPPPDAPSPRFALTVNVNGAGEVRVAGAGACRDECVYSVLGGAVVLDAVADDDWYFDKWGEACGGTDTPTCALIVTSAIVVSAKFREHD